VQDLELPVAVDAPEPVVQNLELRCDGLAHWYSRLERCLDIKLK
jgi:hypothetical protein